MSKKPDSNISNQQSAKSKFSLKLVNRKSLLLILCSFPMLLAYQNCGQTMEAKLLGSKSLPELPAEPDIHENLDFSNSIYSITPHNGGHILVGDFNQKITANSRAPNLAMLNQEGELDTNFQNQGSGFNGLIRSTKVLSNGQILVGGQFTTYNGTNVVGIARLNSDGSLDTSFNSSGTGFYDGNVSTLEVLPSGKILVGGWFSTYNGTLSRSIVRLNSDGSLDTSFIGASNNTVSTIKVLSNGQILVGGQFSSYSEVTVGRIVRLNPNGSLDMSFNSGKAGFDSPVNTIEVLPDGKILVGGYFSYFNGIFRRGLARLNSDGSLDTNFLGGGNSSISSMKVLSNGQILIGGLISYIGSPSYKGNVARLNSDGTIDMSFDSDLNDIAGVRTIELLSNGQIMVGGEYTSCGDTIIGRIARLNSNGSLDSSFNPGGAGFDGSVNTIEVLPDGKILVGGSFNSFNGPKAGRIARISADRILDTSFNSDGAGFNGSVFTIEALPGGQILAGGSFSRYNGTFRKGLVRLNSDGSLDLDFNSGGAGFNNTVSTIEVLSNGQILAVGNFNSYNGTAVGKLVRLNADGTLDTSFNSGGAGFNNVAWITKVLANGQILAGGEFSTYNGTAVGKLVRLNANGTLDTSFNSGGSGISESVSIIEVLANGQILVGGANGVVGKFVRLNANGTLDTSFNSGGTGIYGFVHTIEVLSNGQILVGGSFKSYNDTAVGNIARLNANGTLDTSFNSGGSGISESVSRIEVLSNGQILVGGSFTSYNNLHRFNLTLLSENGEDLLQY